MAPRAAGGEEGPPPEPAPSVLLVTDDNRMAELAVPPGHAGDVHAFVVEATGEDDLEYEDVLVSPLPPALTVAVYTAGTLRRDVAGRNELASTLLGRSVYGPAALVCLEGLPPEADEADAEADEADAEAEEFRVVTAETLARQLAERGRPVPDCGAQIGFPGPFGDLFLSLCARRARETERLDMHAAEPQSPDHPPSSPAPPAIPLLSVAVAPSPCYRPSVVLVPMSPAATPAFALTRAPVTVPGEPGTTSQMSRALAAGAAACVGEDVLGKRKKMAGAGNAARTPPASGGSEGLEREF
jgi:hypothetical protein